MATLLPLYVYDEVARKAGSLNAAMAIKQAHGLYPGAAPASEEQEQLKQWDASVVSVGLLSNVRAGHAATPLSGYVFVAPGKAPVPQGLFSTSGMFKGRVMEPLLDVENSEVKRVLRESGLDAGRILDRFKEKVPRVDLPRFLTEAVHEAYQKVGATSLVSDVSDALVPLDPSDDALGGGQPMLSVVQASNSNAVYLVFEAHCALRGGNAPLERALYDAACEGRSLYDLFWDKTSDFVRLSKRYRDTQIAWRACVMRRVRARIVEAMFGAEVAAKLKLAPVAFDPRSYSMGDAETAYKELHFLTNEDDILDDFFLFFSESQRTTAGALVMGGPFRQGLWVGAEASTVNNRFHGCVPFSVPYAYDKPQNEILNEVARAVVTGTPSEHVLLPQVKEDSTGKKVYLAYDEGSDAELVWPQNTPGSGIQRFLHRHCYETWYDEQGQAAEELLDAYGIDMRLAKINRTVRPIVTVLSAINNPMVDLVTTRLYLSIVRIEMANAAFEEADDQPPPLIPPSAPKAATDDADDQPPPLVPPPEADNEDKVPQSVPPLEEDEEEKPKAPVASTRHFARW